MSAFVDAPSLPASPVASRPPRQALNLRWLAGSLLTGITGAGLIGVALYLAAADGVVPTLPERALPPTARAAPATPPARATGWCATR